MYTFNKFSFQIKLMQNISVYLQELETDSCLIHPTRTNRLQARNDRWHFPDEDDDGTKQDEIPHDQHSDAGSLENVTTRTFQLTHLTFFTFFS
ncbi:hypothetical protein C6499_01065 [Candidatus Poribacteria bacterium]|nr:MAG: hypothetical protein C6499_01065 [Candidatus Poribacteria bacterium]